MKLVRVILLDKAEALFRRLEYIAAQQARDGKTNSDEIQLLKSIKQKRDFIKADQFYGDNIKKHLIPAEYVIKYNARNLWRVELPGFWRMLYTIQGDQEETICFILDIMDHNTYNKKFGYRK